MGWSCANGLETGSVLERQRGGDLTYWHFSGKVVCEKYVLGPDDDPLIAAPSEWGFV